MAASNQESDTKPFRLDDLLNTLRARHGDQSDDDDHEATNTDTLSMFCKNCLHPYSGQEKGGSLVLRCEKCGHRDIVPEEEAANLNPEDWKGNLMMNRFLQVLKEQEDLCINIVDPDFADDDYKRLTLALNEYCTYMNYIAVKIYDIAKEARAGERQNEQLMVRNNESDSNVDNTAEEMTVADENAVNEVGDAKVEHSATSSGEYFVFSECAREEMKNVGATIIKVMKSLIAKHGLSPDIWDKVEKKMRNPTSKEISADNREVQELGTKTAAAESEDDKSPKTDTGDDTDEKEESEEQEAQDAEVDTGSAGQSSDGSKAVAFDIESDVLEREVLGALQSKFKLTGADYNEDEVKIDLTQDYNAVLRETQDVPFNIDDYQRNHLDQENDVQSSHVDSENHSNTEKGIESENETEKSEVIEINFCSASTIFLSELQSRKREALLARKEKALAIVNDKIKKLKAEMERVENEVRDELHVAYETKVKKVENQRRQLSTRHKHVQDIEFLLGHYMETGQMDKLTELMEELDIQYDN